MEFCDCLFCYFKFYRKLRGGKWLYICFDWYENEPTMWVNSKEVEDSAPGFFTVIEEEDYTFTNTT